MAHDAFSSPQTDLAPIALFVYNRYQLTLQTIQYLAQNEEARNSLLYIFADGPKPQATQEQLARIEQVRTLIYDPSLHRKFKEVRIIASDINKGLARSIIEGVSTVVQAHGRVIVLEDDLAVSPYFLKYMNEALHLYENEDRVLAIHGYVYPVDRLFADRHRIRRTYSVELPQTTFFIREPGCLGWATWQRAWRLFDSDARKLYQLIRKNGLSREFNFWGGYPYMRLLRMQIAGKIDSWAICWRAVAYLHHKLTLYPPVTLVSHEGNVPEATHSYSGEEDPYRTTVSQHPVEVKKIPVENHEGMERLFGAYLRKYSGMSIPSKIKKRLRRLFKMLYQHTGHQ